MDVEKTDRDTAAGAQGGQRRYLTVLFSDLCDSARLAAGMEAEHYADLLARLCDIYQTVITRHGGSIVQVVGDGVLASFGYPQSREDDGRRASEAALELHHEVRRLRLDVAVPAVDLCLHSGIHSGLVLLGAGDAVSGPIRLFGNAVNVAARLSDAADDDEILASAEALGAEKNFFVIGWERELRLQGMADPVAVCLVLGRAHVATRFEARAVGGLTPFVGREAELQDLMECLRTVAAGRTRHLALIAPPGVGKTRLAEEFLSRATKLSVRVLRGYCESYLSAEPMQPFRQMLRTLCGVTFGMPADLAATAADRALADIDPQLTALKSVVLRSLSLDDRGKDKTQTETAGNAVSAIATILQAVATQQPLVLFIDDWQWADDATRQLLAAIKGAAPRSLLVLLAAREVSFGDIAMSGTQLIHLAPFTASETETTIAQLLPGQDKFVVAEICEASGGNALFVEELCHSRHFEGMPQRARKAPGSGAWVERLIQTRVERLPPAQLELLRAAAVIGNVVPAQLFETVTGRCVRDPQVAALAEEDLVYPGEQPGTLRFKHGIARDTIYAAVGLVQRKALHERIARTLQQQGIEGGETPLLEPLAHHFAACGQIAEAAHYAELAGDKAVAASALDRAQAHYAKALALIDPGSNTANYRKWMGIAQRLALACVFDPSREQLRVLLRAVELASTHKDRASLAYAEYWAGYVYYALGESRRAIAHLERALDGAQAIGDAPIATQIHATLGQAYAASANYDKASVLLGEAIAIKRAHRKGNRASVGLAYSLACRASVLGDQGNFEAAHNCFDEALTAVRGANHEVEGSVLCWQAGVLLWQGRWEDGHATAKRAQAVAERVKSLYLFAMSSALGAFANWNMQTTATSLQELVDATTWLENGERGLFISLNRGWLSECLADCGQWRAARKQAARAMMRARQGDLLGGAMAYRAMARGSAAGHNRKQTDAYIALAMTNAEARGSAHEAAKVQLVAAAIELARGQRNCGLELLDDAEAKFAAMRMGWHLDEVRKLRQQA